MQSRVTRIWSQKPVNTLIPSRFQGIHEYEDRTPRRRRNRNRIPDYPAASGEVKQDRESLEESWSLSSVVLVIFVYWLYAHSTIALKCIKKSS